MDDNEKTREERQESYNKKIAKYWAELIEGGSNPEELSQAELEKLILDYGHDEFLAELKLPLPRPRKTRKETFSDLAELVCFYNLIFFSFEDNLFKGGDFALKS